MKQCLLYQNRLENNQFKIILREAMLITFVKLHLCRVRMIFTTVPIERKNIHWK